MKLHSFKVNMLSIGIVLASLLALSGENVNAAAAAEEPHGPEEGSSAAQRVSPEEWETLKHYLRWMHHVQAETGFGPHITPGKSREAIERNYRDDITKWEWAKASAATLPPMEHSQPMQARLTVTLPNFKSTLDAARDRALARLNSSEEKPRVD